MNISEEKRVVWTQRLVLAGILLGLVSYGTYKMGVGELYPFAHWRLFSAPMGINEPVTIFRIYGKDSLGGSWQRRPFGAMGTWPRKDQGYVLKHWTLRHLEDPHDQDVRQRLRTAAIALAPEDSQYQVVAETFYSLPLYADSTEFDTTVVARFTR